MKRSYAFTERKSTIYNIGECIAETLKVLKLESKYLETLAITKWEKLMGPTVVSRTEKIYFKGSKMYILLSSAPLKHQLSLSKQQIMHSLNMELGENLIEEIIIL